MFPVQVLSGDAVVIRGTPKRGPPPERILALSNIVAPRLARRPGQQQQQDSKDEVGERGEGRGGEGGEKERGGEKRRGHSVLCTLHYYF